MVKPKKPMSLARIDPRSVNQEKIFREYNMGKNLLIHGYAGTGKTLLSLYLALDNVMNSDEYDKVLIIRSCVPSRAQGFLPGDPNEKNNVYESPYEGICSTLFPATQSPYKTLKGLDIIEFTSTSYLRGQTINNTIVIADEFQDFNDGEINTVVTRIGESSKLIICGDYRQDDLKYLRETSCFENTLRKVRKMRSFSIINMDNINDICRNGLIKEWILADEKIAQEKQNNGLPTWINSTSSRIGMSVTPIDSSTYVANG